jgi:hypothetical protein
VSNLDRQAPCPSCSGPVTFKFAGAKAVVCEYCQFVVVRTDRGLQATGRMADLLEIPSPLQVGMMGTWSGAGFMVEGRIQMDRAGAPGAPWQEFLVFLTDSGDKRWIAYAQGRWYATSEQPLPPNGVPPADSLQPGGTVDLGNYGQWVVAEVAQRRVVAGEGALSLVPAPGVSTRYADISAAGGKFGTIDYGDGTGAAVLFLGSQFDPNEMQLEDGKPLEMPEATASTVTCPNCGGDLPLMSQQSERIVCQYCGTASDVNQGNLAALGPAPKPPIEPYIPMGAEGQFRGAKYIVCGFVIRSCMVEGQMYSWREYLLFGGEKVGYRWLMEEDGAWQFVENVPAGDVMDSGHGAMFRGGQYRFKQQVTAKVDYVIGEFYWKVEIGETVEAAEFEGPGGKVSREKSSTEVNYSFVSPVQPQELAAFGVAPPPAAAAAFGGSGFGSQMDQGGETGGASSIMTTMVVIVVICLVLSVMMGGACGGSGGSSYGSSGGSWSK